MAEDKLLSMSLDDIIKLKKASSSRSSSQTKTNPGTRGKANFSVNRRRGRIGVASNRNLRRGGGGVSYRNNRGTFRRRGYPVGQRNLPLRIEDRMLQRERSIALARNRLQMAKRFLNLRQRIPRRNMGAVDRSQFRRMLHRGSNRGIKRGRGGFRFSSELSLNTFRSGQLSRINAYNTKVNRAQSAALRNQVPATQSLIVSIENERAGSVAASSSGSQRGGRRGMRKRGNLSRGNPSRGNLSRGNLSRGNLSRGNLSRGNLSRGNLSRGNLSRLNLPTMQLSNDMYQQRNSTPFHTGALNPEIQRMIADIQGKTSPPSGRIGNRLMQRGSGGGTARGFGMSRGQRGLGRGQMAERQLNTRVIDGLNMGLPMTTACTLNERFGGRI